MLVNSSHHLSDVFVQRFKTTDFLNHNWSMKEWGKFHEVCCWFDHRALGIVLVAADQPNILFIIADDASRDSFGAYGCQYVKTPGFDRIAREGVLLHRHITAIQSVLQHVPAC